MAPTTTTTTTTTTTGSDDEEQEFTFGDDNAAAAAAATVTTATATVVSPPRNSMMKFQKVNNTSHNNANNNVNKTGSFSCVLPPVLSATVTASSLTMSSSSTLTTDTDPIIMNMTKHNNKNNNNTTASSTKRKGKAATASSDKLLPTKAAVTVTTKTNKKSKAVVVEVVKKTKASSSTTATVQAVPSVVSSSSSSSSPSSTATSPAPATNTTQAKAKTKNKTDKLVPTMANKTVSKTKKTRATLKTPTHTTTKTLKKLDKMERITYAMQSFQWWTAPDPPQGCQWTTMEHAGVRFPEPYVPHHVPLLYNHTPIVPPLTPIQEEAATFFASMDPDGMHLGNPQTADIFIRNWFTDFRKLLPSTSTSSTSDTNMSSTNHTITNTRKVITQFEKLNFDRIRQHVQDAKQVQKAVTDAQKQQQKDTRNQALFQYAFCLIDGHVERVGNFNMEPPGTFRGRGAHPKMGMLKQRVMPEQVSINVAEQSPVPALTRSNNSNRTNQNQNPMPGHAWSDVRHDPRGQWLATWKENINQQSKYMQLSAQSSFKGKSDYKKYGTAAQLCGPVIAGIRKQYKKDLRCGGRTTKSGNEETRQLATAVWVIDRLALRVGGEKDTDEEADTVGCCSLRVEHVHFVDIHDTNNYEIELEFLGKDSMLFKQTIDFGAALYNHDDHEAPSTTTANGSNSSSSINNDGGSGRQVYRNLVQFCHQKQPSEEVFDRINPTLLNAHLKQFMDGLSAKVFRTYNASKTLQDELLSHENKGRLWTNRSVAEKVMQYNHANRQVAILCNHQRSVSKAQETQLGNLAERLQTLKKQKKILKKMLKSLNEDNSSAKANKNKNTTTNIPLKKPLEKKAEAVQKALEKAKQLKERAQTQQDKIRATEHDEKAKQMKRALAEAKFHSAHLWDAVPRPDQVSKRIEMWNAKIAKLEVDLQHKDDNKEVSLGTSKINYMDPRITVAFCKRNEIPIEKIFSKTLRDKFNWAMAVPPDWEFNASIGEKESS